LISCQRSCGEVDNIGGSPADNVTVRLPLPDTVQPVSADGGDDWTCTVGRDVESGQRVWDCVKPRFEAEQLELVSPIQLVAAGGAGTPEGPLTFTATVRTDSPEPITDNNTLQATTTYQAQGSIGGRVWLDQDRDGQRDPGEPPVENGGDGVRALRLIEGGPDLSRLGHPGGLCPQRRHLHPRSRRGGISSASRSARRWTTPPPTSAMRQPTPTSSSPRGASPR
jgi:hypothetical protein